jgi:hypothetical protein
LDAKVACGISARAASIWPGLVGVTVDRLFAEHDQLGLLEIDDRIEQLGHVQRLKLVVGLDQNGAIRSHGQSRAQVSWHFASPHETAITSVTTPFSFKRTASSTAISSKGFMLILTLAMSTPVPSLFTRTFTL